MFTILFLCTTDDDDDDDDGTWMLDWNEVDDDDDDDDDDEVDDDDAAAVPTRFDLLDNLPALVEVTPEVVEQEEEEVGEFWPKRGSNVSAVVWSDMPISTLLAASACSCSWGVVVDLLLLMALIIRMRSLLKLIAWSYCSSQ